MEKIVSELLTFLIRLAKSRIWVLSIVSAMVGLREVPRTATFAWSPSTSSTLLATGTRAGAVDADFSNETQLELWDLDLSNTKKGIELQPSASIDTDSRWAKTLDCF